MIDISALSSHITCVHVNPNYGKKSTHKRGIFLRELANEQIHGHDESLSRGIFDNTPFTSSTDRRNAEDEEPLQKTLYKW